MGFFGLHKASKAAGESTVVAWEKGLRWVLWYCDWQIKIYNINTFCNHFLACFIINPGLCRLFYLSLSNFLETSARRWAHVQLPISVFDHDTSVDWLSFILNIFSIALAEYVDESGLSLILICLWYYYFKTEKVCHLVSADWNKFYMLMLLHSWKDINKKPVQKTVIQGCCNIRIWKIALIFDLQILINSPWSPNVSVLLRSCAQKTSVTTANIH